MSLPNAQKEKKSTVLILKNKNLSEKTQNIFNGVLMSNITDLNLNSNNFTKIPPEILKMTSLTSLDISNNPLTDYDQAIEILQQLKYLVALKIDLHSKEKASLLLKSLPNLLILNGQPTKGDKRVEEIDITEAEVEKMSMKNEIDNFNAILNTISSLANYSKNFKNEFMTFLKEKIDALNDHNSSANYVFCVNVLKTKFEIYDYLHKNLCSMCSDETTIDKSTMISIIKLLDEIKTKNNLVQTDLVNLILGLSPKIEQQIIFYRKEYNSLKTKLEEFQNEMQSKEKFNRILYDDNKDLRQKIKTSENTLKNNQGRALNSMRSKENSSNYFSNSSQNQRSFPFHSLNKNKSSGNMLASTITPRDLTQTQLISFINELYNSKIQYDKKCSEMRLPKETLEQYMYTYLNNKYGLKNITIEWATSVINGIKKFSLVNSEVCLFGKILRNELEEESQQVYLKLKSTIFELLSYYFQTKFPYKPLKEITDLVAAKKKTELNEEEWKTVIKYLFPKDSENVTKKIYEFAEKKNLLGISKKNSKQELYSIRKSANAKTREEIKQMKKDNQVYIKTNDFLKILLEIQIRLRDKYLANFLEEFKQVDEDHDGIINEEGFRKIICDFNLFPLEELEEKIDDLLEKIDPYNTDVITFSDFVTLLSNEYVDEEGKKKILDKIAEINMSSSRKQVTE